MKSDNVIDFQKHLKKQRDAEAKKSKPAAKNKASVTDMTERRQEMIQDERRQVRRTILSGFIGACVVIPGQGLMRVEIYDISDSGISFDMSDTGGKFASGEQVAMRIYMNQTTYFPFVVTVQNVRGLSGEEANRHGAHFEKGTVNDQALNHFVKFIETVSASLQRDEGDVMVSNLGKK